MEHALHVIKITIWTIIAYVLAQILYANHIMIFLQPVRIVMMDTNLLDLNVYNQPKLMILKAMIQIVWQLLMVLALVVLVDII